jgi:FkbM family methyltransferase
MKYLLYIRRILKNSCHFAQTSGGLKIPFFYLVNTFLSNLNISNRYAPKNLTLLETDFGTYIGKSWDFIIIMKLDFEFKIRNKIKEILKSGDFSDMYFINIGAHAGRYPIEFGDHFYRTFAFEPTPETFRYLSVNVFLSNKSDRVGAVNACVGDRNGKVVLELNENESTNSVKMDKNPEEVNANDSSVIVDMIKFDDFLLEDKRIGLMIIDVEGAEVEVLAGMTRTLSRKLIFNLIVELLDDESANKVSGILKEYGYKSEQLDPTNWLFSQSVN